VPALKLEASGYNEILEFEFRASGGFPIGWLFLEIFLIPLLPFFIFLAVIEEVISGRLVLTGHSGVIVYPLSVEVLLFSLCFI